MGTVYVQTAIAWFSPSEYHWQQNQQHDHKSNNMGWFWCDCLLTDTSPTSWTMAGSSSLNGGPSFCGRWQWETAFSVVAFLNTIKSEINYKIDTRGIPGEKYRLLYSIFVTFSSVFWLGKKTTTVWVTTVVPPSQEIENYSHSQMNIVLNGKLWTRGGKSH